MAACVVMTAIYCLLQVDFLHNILSLPVEKGHVLAAQRARYTTAEERRNVPEGYCLRYRWLYHYYAGLRAVGVKQTPYND